MKARCIEVANKTLGRESTPKEQRDIESRMSDAMKSLALRDPESWFKTAPTEKMNLAAKVAAEDLLAEVQKKRERLEYTIQATDAINNHAEQQLAGGYDQYKLESLQRQIVDLRDGKNNTDSIESHSEGVKEEILRQLVEPLQTIAPKYLGFIADSEAEINLRKAMHGEDVGSPEITKAAKAIQDTFELIRQRINAAGGDIGLLENRGHGHSWSLDKFVELGREKVLGTLRDRIDPRKYVHDDGSFFTPTERENLLSNFYDTVSKNGANKELKQGSGIKADRGSEHRVIHFKDGASATEALKILSEQTLWQSILGEVEHSSKHIAILEKFGANPDHNIANLIDEFRQHSVMNGMEPKKADSLAHDISSYYNHISGYNNLPIKRVWLNNFVQGWRNLQLLKLGFSPITALGDTATMFQTAMAGNLSSRGSFVQLMKGLDITNQKEKRMAMRAGLMSRTLTQDARRMALDDIKTGITGKIGAAFMRATQLNRFNEVQRRAYKVMAMDTIGQLTRDNENIKNVEQGDHKFLLAKGIDQKTWDIWRQAKLDGWDTGEHTMLTPEAIYNIEGLTPVEKNKAASRLMSVIVSETNMAVVEPGVRYHSMLDKARRGTYDGEFFRSFMTFKSFPISFLWSHGERSLKGYNTKLGKMKSIASLVAMSWTAGIIANWAQDILNGKNPRNINPARGKFENENPLSQALHNQGGTANLISGLLKGGGLGIYGDFLLGTLTQGGRNFAETVAGPVVSDIGAAADVVRSATMNVSDDKNKKDIGANSIKAIRSKLPIDLWYTRAIMDHLIFQELQNAASPGYLSRVEQKAAQRGDSYYIKPGMNSPETINLKHAIGDQ